MARLAPVDKDVMRIYLDELNGDRPLVLDNDQEVVVRVAHCMNFIAVYFKTHLVARTEVFQNVLHNYDPIHIRDVITEMMVYFAAHEDITVDAPESTESPDKLHLVDNAANLVVDTATYFVLHPKARQDLVSPALLEGAVDLDPYRLVSDMIDWYLEHIYSTPSTRQPVAVV
jgi:hypothetical protein